MCAVCAVSVSLTLSVTRVSAERESQSPVRVQSAVTVRFGFCLFSGGELSSTTVGSVDRAVSRLRPVQYFSMLYLFARGLCALARTRELSLATVNF